MEVCYTYIMYIYIFQQIVIDMSYATRTKERVKSLGSSVRNQTSVK